MSNQGDGGSQHEGGQQGDTGGQWSGGQQQQGWTGGQQPWTTGGQQGQPWSGQTGPNLGPTMNNPQNSYYDRFSEASGEGITGPQPGGKGGGGRGKVLIGLAAALVVIVAAVAIFAFTRGDGSPKQAATSGAAKSSLAPVKATTWVNPTLAAGARPLKDGWQVQSSLKLGGQYDVPKSKDWKVESNSYVIYYPGKNPGDVITAAGGIAEYKAGFCDGDDDTTSAWIGLRDISKSDPKKVGRQEAEKLAKGIATSTKDGKDAKPGKVSAAEKITVDQGTIPAYQYTVTTEAGDQNACDKGKKYEARTVNFSTPDRAYQLVTVRLLGSPDTLSSSGLEEIISTFRTDS